MFGGEKRPSSSDRADTRKWLRPDDSGRPSHGETFEERARYYSPYHSLQDKRASPGDPEGALSDQVIQERLQEPQGSRNQDTQAGSSRSEGPVFFSHFQELEKRLLLDESPNPQQVEEIHDVERLKEWERSLQDELSRLPQQDPPMPRQGGPDQASASNAEQVDETKCQQIVEQLLNPPSKRKKMPYINGKEVDKIINILEEKQKEGLITPEIYKNCKRRIQKKLKQAEYDKNHKDTIKVKQAEYRKNHKDTLRVKRAEYYKNNNDIRKAKQAEYRKNHNDTIKVKRAEYYKNNKDTIKIKNDTRKAKRAEYRKNHNDTIKVKRAEYYKKQ